LWLSGPHSAPKEGELVVNQNGTFRVAYCQKGCGQCDHLKFSCAGIGCGKYDFILLTEINYITHRLTK